MSQAAPDPRLLGFLGPVAAVSVAQLFGTSLWFSANSAADGLRADWGASAADIGALTNAVQAGFIVGTLALMGVFMAWLFGYIDWSRAIMVLVAVVGVAAAPTLAATIFGGGA